MSERYPGTIFLDIDGCILHHYGQGLSGQINHLAQLLPGVLEKLKMWDEAGYTIVLTTGRKESARRKTEKTLCEMGLFWSVLLMGLPRGERVVINDSKTDGTQTARGITVKRNEGLENVEL